MKNMNIVPNWFRDNFRVKAGMLLLAMLLWFLVITEKSFDDTLKVPITLIGMPSGKISSTPMPKFALVRFHGRGKELMRLKYVSKPHLNLEVTGFRNSHWIHLRPEMVSLPGGITVMPIEVVEPDSVNLTLEDFIGIESPVKAKLDLEFAPGYTLAGPPEITPAKVRLSGPDGMVTQNGGVETLPIVLKDLRRTTEVPIGLNLPERFGIETNPQSVVVLLKVEKIGERELSEIPVKAKDVPEGRVARPDPPSVRIQIVGAVSRLSGLEPRRIKAWINCSTPDTTRPGWYSVHVDLPEGIELKTVIPSSIKVVFRK